ncbi:MAG: alpha/beta fold hydrolase [Deltaproteobacteria bacterium]|nr:alpha/beta fold hydrolase [Deltaproteobacteria bacterium]
MPACLLIHGFTATPPVMGFLKKSLEEAGFFTVTPALAGHGGDWQGYEESGWPEWYESVRVAYREMVGRYSPIFVAGQSLGGLLSLKLALDVGPAIRGVTCLATPLYLDSFLARFLLPVIWKTPVREVYRFQPKFGQASLEDPEGLRQFRQWSHPKMPIRAIVSIRELQDQLRPALGGFKTPLQVIYSRKDPLISGKTNRFFREKIPAQKEFLILERSGHIISMDYEKEVVVRKMVEFFKSLSHKEDSPKGRER